MTEFTTEIRTEVNARLGSLSRFAGWLGKGRSFDETRAHVKGLATAFDGQADAGPWLTLLDADLQRLPSSEVRKMLRKELEAIVVLMTTSLDEDRT
jgi:hypothetical protein